MPPGHISPEQQEAMFDKAAAPLLESLKGDPNNFQTVVKVGNLYYDGKQYDKAVDFYKRALQIDPNNADVRTDLGTSYWYMGNADEAIKEFQRSLKIRPDHAGTLFNMGIVKWQGKMDPAGAVAAWQELLKRNPNYPQKQQIEDFVAKAKQHAKA
ncbi:MAG: tetratricopeptide repeat protein [Acidobacteriales bacterium]|nr:tetratricopeptide repeat protein [Terriglobales bacterium]